MSAAVALPRLHRGTVTLTYAASAGQPQPVPGWLVGDGATFAIHRQGHWRRPELAADPKAPWVLTYLPTSQWVGKARKRDDLLALAAELLPIFAVHGSNLPTEVVLEAARIVTRYRETGKVWL